MNQRTKRSLMCGVVSFVIIYALCIAFGANIPAAVEVLFGYEVPEGPTGTLPVDLPTVKDGVLQVEEIRYKIGEASKEWK